MGAARLILIEGMIGSCKTMTAARAGEWLAGRGQNVRVFREGADDHPIRTMAEDRLRAAAGLQAPAPNGAGNGAHAGSHGGYPAGQWRQLATRCVRDRQTIIVEGSFLQNCVMPAFLDDAPARTVTEIFTAIVRQAAPAAPLLCTCGPPISARRSRARTGYGESRGHRGMWTSSRTQPGRAAADFRATTP